MEQFISISEPNNLIDTELNDHNIGKEVEVFGMVHNTRISKWGGFLILRKAKGLLQSVFKNESSFVIGLNGEDLKLKDISRESAIKIRGVITSANIKDVSVFYKTIEISINSIEILSIPGTDNLIDLTSLSYDSESNFSFKLDNRHISLRNTRDISIFKISSQIANSFGDYLLRKDFTQIFSPKIVSAGAEGGANIFELEYFGKKAYLAQSPQLYKQICVGVFERVFEIAPAFRAEKHNTSRHLNEYISLDIEMGFTKDHTDIMKLELEVLKQILNDLETNCKHELAVLNDPLPKLPDDVPIYRLSEVHELLHEHFPDRLTQDHRGEHDLAPEEEILICEYALSKYNSDFVFVTHFPSKQRAFYSMDDPEDPELTLSFDLLLRGREITSGSQRVHEESVYRKKMIDRGMNPDNFRFYLEAFKNGMPPHSGLAIGLERLTAGFLNIQNVKEASLFPRDINRITP